MRACSLFSLLGYRLGLRLSTIISYIINLSSMMRILWRLSLDRVDSLLFFSKMSNLPVEEFFLL